MTRNEELSWRVLRVCFLPQNLGMLLSANEVELGTLPPVVVVSAKADLFPCCEDLPVRACKEIKSCNLQNHHLSNLDGMVKYTQFRKADLIRQD